ncbi:MAG TPA: hypothetical protein VGD29_25300 [Actinoplanes sp.]
MTAGYVLGERHRRNDRSQQAAQGSSQTGQTGQAARTTVAASPSPSISGTACPQPAQDAAAALGAGGLSQILMIKTSNHATVWICEDPAGRLYYQSHTLVNGEDLPLTQNLNGLFLPNVTSTDSGYVVFDQKRDKFVVTRKSLRISFVDGREESDKVDTEVG